MPELGDGCDGTTSFDEQNDESKEDVSSHNSPSSGALEPFRGMRLGKDAVNRNRMSVASLSSGLGSATPRLREQMLR